MAASAASLSGLSGLSGYVYCMTNPYMPKLVKVGFTRNDPYERAKQLYTTGVPCEFHVDFAKKVADCELREKQLHVLLAKYYSRVNESREFFECSSTDVFELFELLEGTYLHSINPDPMHLRQFAYQGPLSK